MSLKRYIEQLEALLGEDDEGQPSLEARLRRALAEAAERAESPLGQRLRRA